MSFFRELKDFYRFHKQTSKNKKQIIFYAEHAGYYPNFEGLLVELLDHYNQPVTYITSDINDPILQTNNRNLTTFYSNLLFPFLMQFLKTKVMVMTLSDLNQFQIKRSVHSVHYVYVFHSLVSMHMSYNKGAFDHYDSVLCAGAYQEEEFREYEKLYNQKEKQLVSAGYYRLERIYEKYENKKRANLQNKKTILIAPSWGDKNILETCGIELTQLLLDAGYNVIVRPHPQAVIQDPQLMRKLEATFKDNSAFVFERSIETDDSLLNADVLICDCSGVALEYALGTERPVLFLDVPIKIKNPEYTNLSYKPFELTSRKKIGVIVSIDKLSNVVSTIEELISKKDVYQKKLRKLRSDTVYGFGDSCKIGAQHILKMAAVQQKNPE
jgi:CDP-glycerol glycerophosphotransferase (TagB/SpsB family)